MHYDHNAFTNHTFYAKKSSVLSKPFKLKTSFENLNSIKSKRSITDFPQSSYEKLRDENIHLKIENHKVNQVNNALKAEVSKASEDNKKILLIIEDLMSKSGVDHEKLMQYIGNIREGNFENDLELNFNEERILKLTEIYRITKIKSFTYKLKEELKECRDELNYLKNEEKVVNILKLKKELSQKIFELKELKTCFINLKRDFDERESIIKELRTREKTSTEVKRNPIPVIKHKSNHSTNFRSQENFIKEQEEQSKEVTLLKQKIETLKLEHGSSVLSYQDQVKKLQDEVEHLKTKWKESIDRFNLVKLSNNSLNENFNKLLDENKMLKIENSELRKQLEQLLTNNSYLEEKFILMKKQMLDLTNQDKSKEKEETMNFLDNIDEKENEIKENKHRDLAKFDSRHLELDDESVFQQTDAIGNKKISESFHISEIKALATSESNKKINEFKSDENLTIKEAINYEGNQIQNSPNNAKSSLKKKNTLKKNITYKIDPTVQTENENNEEDTLKNKIKAKKQYTVITEEGDIDPEREEEIENSEEPKQEKKEKQKITEISTKWNNSRVGTKRLSQSNTKARYSLKVDKTDEQVINPHDSFFIVDKSFDINSFQSTKRAKSVNMVYNKLPTLDRVLTEKIMNAQDFDELMEDPQLKNLFEKKNIKIT